MFKTYSTKTAATKAINKAGLQNVPYEIQPTMVEGKKRFKPMFMPELKEDVAYIRYEKGFAAHKAKPE